MVALDLDEDRVGRLFNKPTANIVGGHGSLQ